MTVPLLSALCLGGSPSVSVAQPEGPEEVCALVLSSGSEIAPAAADHLQREGIKLITRPLSEPLDQQILRQFDLVMLTDFAGLQTPYFFDAQPGGFISQYYTIKQNLVELQQYVESGGGLFFSPWVTGAGLATTETLRPLLGGWGVEALPANARDEAHAWESYSWTTNVADSPVTEGVQTLYYPVEMGRWDDAYPTIPFSLHDPRWQAVVRGMPGSVVARCLQYTTWYPVPEAQNPPVLAAVAQIGRGRVALLAINQFYTFLYPYEQIASGNIGEFHTGDIKGVVVEKGDGQTPSDGWRLICNSLRWAAEPAAGEGMGTYTPEAYAALPTPAAAEVPGWLRGWYEGNGASYYKVLIGARSAYSTGQGSLAEYAAAAREAGYAILVMTEDLDAFAAERWPQFLAECREASSADFVVIPGLDINDAYGNRLLLFGQTVFPPPWMLSPDGKDMKEIQYLMLGFGECCSAIAHPTSCPLPQELFKFFSGVVVYTYDQEARLIDDGTQAYQTQIYNMSDPMPLVTHEVYSPEQIATASQSGHQLYVLADSVENAAWYMRDGEAHFWETPVKLLVSSGPLIRTLNAGGFTVESDVPIAEARYYTQYNLLRRWTPHETRFTAEVALWPGSLYLGFIWVADAQGRTAISPMLRSGAGSGYNWRCSDRQNFFSVAVNYTGTILSDGVDVWLPTFGTDEGRGLWPHQGGPQRGENLAPLLEFPFISPVVTVTDAVIDQRYWKALWEDVVFDAKAPQGTSPSRVYEGRVRYYDLQRQYQPYNQRSGELVPMVLMELELRLRQPVVPSGNVFPAFVGVGAQPECVCQDQPGAWITKRLTEGYVDLPVGGQAGDLVALTPGLRVNAQGQVGFAPPAQDHGALPEAYSWRAQWVRLDPQVDAAELRKIMGLDGPTPFTLQLSRGKLDRVAYVANMTAEQYGVAGEVSPYPEMPRALHLRIAGLNCNWPAGVWQAGAEPDLVPCGVFEQEGWGNLDVTPGGPFYAGNLVRADDSRLRLGIVEWTHEGIFLEVNNPTDEALRTTVRTPPEIAERYRLEQSIQVEPGTSVRLRFPEQRGGPT